MTPPDRSGDLVRRALRALNRSRSPNETDSGQFVVELSGDIDAGNTDRISHELRAALLRRPAELVIDLARVDHIAPVGTSAFFALARASRCGRTAITVRRASPDAWTVLKRAGLGQLMTLEAPLEP
ncbi:STAS domain-containing protein [Kitasatospora indigofera]|uniref:STAS domain-containing protein n=1 Tax=Kitasatospora indigofera TaxID=67307 RepID=UPI00363DEEB8